MTRVSFGLVAMLVILSVVTGCTPTPATTRAATAPPPQVSAPTVVEARGDTVAPQYRPDELYEQLKNHPSRGPTVPPFFLYALPLEQLKDMANVKELSVLYRGEEKPWVFNTHYSGEGKSLGIAVAVVRPDSPFSAEGIVNREKRYVREEQSSAMQTWDITLVPLGDFGYLQINRLTPENVPAGFLPPGLSPSDVVEVAQLVFIKGEVWVSIITYGGFIRPEQLVEIATGFERLLID